MILLAALRFLIPDHLQRLNGLKNVMVGVANGVAAILFVIVAHVAWDAAALIAVGSIAGAQLGARYGRRIPERRLRWIVTVGVYRRGDRVRRLTRAVRRRAARAPRRAPALRADRSRSTAFPAVTRPSKRSGIVKLVIGIVRPEKANDVLEALYRAEVRGVSISRVQGHGGELDRVETYRGTTVKMGLSDKVRFEIAVSDQFVQPTIDALCEGARTGEVGDGKIFVVPLERVVRIRTGETDDAAVTPVGA